VVIVGFNKENPKNKMKKAERGREEGTRARMRGEREGGM